MDSLWSDDYTTWVETMLTMNNTKCRKWPSILTTRPLGAWVLKSWNSIHFKPSFLVRLLIQRTSFCAIFPALLSWTFCSFLKSDGIAVQSKCPESSRSNNWELSHGWHMFKSAVHMHRHNFSSWRYARLSRRALRDQFRAMVRIVGGSTKLRSTLVSMQLLIFSWSVRHDDSVQ